MLDLRRMMLLSDLADLGTVTAVAERRCITSSAVSQQLRVLEKETGAILFRRDGRTLTLTRSGHVLVEHVRRVLGAVDEALSAVAATRGSVAGQIAVASFNMGVSMLAAPTIQQLRIAEPDLQIHLQQAPSQAGVRLLRQGEVDIAITCRYDFDADDPWSGLAGDPLLHEPLVLMAPSHLHLRIRGRGLSALAGESWVTGPRDSRLDTAVERAGKSAGFIPEIKHRVIGAQNICDLAATEVGAAIVPRLSVPAHLEGLIVDGLHLGVRTISAVVREGRQRDPNIATILRTLRTIAAEIAPAPRADRLSIAS
ncbi:transcriptional regulator [Actinoplanes ianthinogenes]|uniref:Transcriptional regulator n=1 Tax=Actinoplanes ianthinogenes TaxID=122358 RepID=A0ABN6CRD3_9ACTN|nr:LysR family transcriptional regulator [Actinoplanes ianthinogenes]BCJ47675.1 transcriptional regulator [Actinoplanes ianthinogenes]GGR03381.1 transcriptional regulator [Actinoplanes ianthinogenes]